MTQNQQEITGNGEKYPAYRWVVIGLLVLTQEVSVLLAAGIGMLLPGMRKDLDFGVAESGVLGSLNQLPTLLLIPMTLLLVRFSPKRVYFGALVFAAVAGFFCGQAPAFLLLAVVYFLKGVGVMVRQIPDTLLRLQWIPKKEFATVQGVTMGMVAMGQSGGIIIIPFLLILLGGWRNLFSVYALVLFLMSIIWIVLARERITPAYQEGMNSRAGRSPLKGVLKHKEFLALGLGTLGVPFAYMATLIFLPTYLLEERGMALTTIGLITGLMPIGGVCANLTMGFVSDRIGLRKPTMWPSGLLQPFLYFILFSPIPVWALPVLAFVTGFVAWTPFAAIRTIPFELPGIKPSEVAVGQALVSTLTALGPILGSLTVGYLAETLGSLRTALSIAGVFPLTITISWFFLPETGPKAYPKAYPKGGERDKGSEVD